MTRTEQEVIVMAVRLMAKSKPAAVVEVIRDAVLHDDLDDEEVERAIARLSRAQR